MSGLNHEFIVIDASSTRSGSHNEFRSLPKVELHDDFLQYFSDSLAWIPSFNPCKNEKHEGLCWYGVTLIQEDGIAKAVAVFRAWLQLLSEAPDTIQLRGLHTTIEGSPEPGDYAKIILDKADICKKLRELVEFCEEVIQSGGTKSLLHLGI